MPRYLFRLWDCLYTFNEVKGRSPSRVKRCLSVKAMLCFLLLDIFHCSIPYGRPIKLARAHRLFIRFKELEGLDYPVYTIPSLA
jgi:hypothetical protein